MLSPMQSVSDNAPMARSRSHAGYLPVRQSTNHAPVPIAARGVLVSAAVFDVLSGVARYLGAAPPMESAAFSPPP